MSKHSIKSKKSDTKQKLIQKNKKRIKRDKQGHINKTIKDGKEDDEIIQNSQNTIENEKDNQEVQSEIEQQQQQRVHSET